MVSLSVSPARMPAIKVVCILCVCVCIICRAMVQGLHVLSCLFAYPHDTHSSFVNVYVSDCELFSS